MLCAVFVFFYFGHGLVTTQELGGAQMSAILQEIGIAVARPDGLDGHACNHSQNLEAPNPCVQFKKGAGGGRLNAARWNMLKYAIVCLPTFGYIVKGGTVSISERIRMKRYRFTQRVVAADPTT